jgi:hypothetical protein
MRKSVTLSWIEQAEAARVLSSARFERAPAEVWCDRAGDALADWSDRLRHWLTPRQSLGGPAWQLQPVRVRHCRRGSRYDNKDYACRW